MIFSFVISSSNGGLNTDVKIKKKQSGGATGGRWRRGGESTKSRGIQKFSVPMCKGEKKR